MFVWRQYPWTINGHGNKGYEAPLIGWAFSSRCCPLGYETKEQPSSEKGFAWDVAFVRFWLTRVFVKQAVASLRCAFRCLPSDGASRGTRPTLSQNVSTAYIPIFNKNSPYISGQWYITYHIIPVIILTINKLTPTMKNSQKKLRYTPTPSAESTRSRRVYTGYHSVRKCKDDLGIKLLTMQSLYLRRSNDWPITGGRRKHTKTDAPRYVSYEYTAALAPW